MLLAILVYYYLKAFIYFLRNILWTQKRQPKPFAYFLKTKLLREHKSKGGVEEGKVELKISSPVRAHYTIVKTYVFEIFVLATCAPKLDVISGKARDQLRMCVIPRNQLRKNLMAFFCSTMIEDYMGRSRLLYTDKLEINYICVIPILVGDYVRTAHDTVPMSIVLSVSDFHLAKNNMRKFNTK